MAKHRGKLARLKNPMRALLALFSLLLLSWLVLVLFDGANHPEPSVQQTSYPGQSEELIAQGLQKLEPRDRAPEPSENDRKPQVERLKDPVVEVTQDEPRIPFALQEPVAVQATTTGESSDPPEQAEAWQLAVLAQNHLQEKRWLRLPFDAQGLASFRLRKNEQWIVLVAIAPQSASLGTTFLSAHTLDEENPGRILLHLEPCSPIKGQVLDDEGKPVPRAVVHLYPHRHYPATHDWFPGFQSTRTDTHGRYRFPRLSQQNWSFSMKPAPWLVTRHGWRDPLSSAWSWQQTPSATRTMDTHVMRVWSKQVTVVDSLDRPVPMAQVDIVRQAGPHENSEFVNTSFHSQLPRTDAQGIIRTYLPKGDWLVHASRITGCPPTDPVPWNVQDENLLIRLPLPCVRVQGIMEYQGGEPVSESIFQLEQAIEDDGWRCTTRTNAEGAFDFGSVAEPVAANLRTRNYQGVGLPYSWRLSTEELATPLHLTLTRTVSIPLLMTRTDEESWADRRYVIAPKSWRPDPSHVDFMIAPWKAIRLRQRFQIPADGKVTLSGIAPGTYTLALMRNSRIIQEWQCRTGQGLQQLVVEPQRKR